MAVLELDSSIAATAAPSELVRISTEYATHSLSNIMLKAVALVDAAAVGL